MSRHLLLAAVDYAARMHRDQRRKDHHASPYINHPVEVARLIAEIAGIDDAEILSAAVLHDTIEDTEATAADLERRFGARVRAIVEEVSDDKSLHYDERKRRQIEDAPALSHEAALVKIADKIANVADIARGGPRGWSRERCRRYLDWAEAVVAGCPAVDAALERRFAEVLGEARRALAGE